MNRIKKLPTCLKPFAYAWATVAFVFITFVMFFMIFVLAWTDSRGPKNGWTFLGLVRENFTAWLELALDPMSFYRN